jgi:phosphatidyl-myo-inositol dimannoside synthase
MRRILLITHEFSPFRGGIGRVAEGLAEGAVACGLEPVVLAPDYGSDQRADDARRSYRVDRFPGSFCSMVSPRRLIRFTELCRRAIAREKPDLVHGVDPAAQMALTMLARLGSGRPHALTIHGTELLRYRSEALPRWWMRGAFARSDALCAVSDAVHGLLLRDFRVRPGQSFVTHPGIGPIWFDTPAKAPATARARWNIPADALVVLTIARRVPEKGQDRVLAGLARLPEPLRRRTVYFVAGSGPGAYAHDLEAAASAAGVRLIMADTLSDADLVEACDAADLFAMLSRRTARRLEGFGLTYIEAGARGLPSLACDTGGASEAVLDQRTGTVLPGDAGEERIGEALLLALQDDGVRRQQGEQAARRARTLTYASQARLVYGRFAEILGL